MKHSAPTMHRRLPRPGCRIQQIHHETAQTIRMQRAIGFANQLLAVAEMINSFQMKLIDMIKKAVSR